MTYFLWTFYALLDPAGLETGDFIEALVSLVRSVPGPEFRNRIELLQFTLSNCWFVSFTFYLSEEPLCKLKGKTSAELRH